MIGSKPSGYGEHSPSTLRAWAEEYRSRERTYTVAMMDMALKSNIEQATKHAITSSMYGTLADELELAATVCENRAYVRMMQTG